jgi:hypothetical protein
MWLIQDWNDETIVIRDPNTFYPDVPLFSSGLSTSHHICIPGSRKYRKKRRQNKATASPLVTLPRYTHYYL